MTTEKQTKKRLDKAQKIFVVRCLARFMSPSDVADLVMEDFSVEITRQAIEQYDPTKFAGQGLKEELKRVFDEERAAFMANASNIDIASKNFRLVELSKLYRQAVENGKDVIAAQFLEQAAKEQGGLYTNKREHSGPGGGAIPLDVGDKKKELAAQMLRKLIEKGKSEEDARASLIAMGVNERDLPTV